MNRTASWNFVEDPRLIARLVEARGELRSENIEVNASTLAERVGQSVFFVLLGIQRQNAWGKLGLNHEVECAGPQYKYH
jgi:hypothetical protein